MKDNSILTGERVLNDTFYAEKKLRMEDEAKEIIRRYEDLKSKRSVWDGLFQDIRELVRPNAEDFTGKTAKGMLRNELIFDDTPGTALDTLASGIHSFITNPSARWFEFLTKDVTKNKDYGVLAWLEGVSERVYNYKRLPHAQWGSSMHELYMELGAFGTGVCFSYWDAARGIIMYRTFPLAHCWIDENDQGMVDTVYRKCCWTTRQAKQYFGNNLPEKILTNTDNREWEFVYAVFPREERNLSSKLSKDMPYAAVWVSVDFKEILSVSGFKSFPYQVPRWQKLSGEIYGRSPAMGQLQNIRVLNAMMKVVLQSSQLQAAPPLLVEDENVLSKVNLAPYELIYTQPGSENPVRPLQLGGSLAVNLDMVQKYREAISRGFYNDLFRLPETAGRDRVTATEFMETRDYQLRQLSPILGRLEVELLQPQLERDYDVLNDHSTERNPIIPPAPPSLRGATMDINYVSPAALAQKGAKASNMQRYMADLAQFAQIKPDIFDALDMDGIVQDLAILRNVSRERVLSPDDLQSMRDSKQQEKQMMMAMQAAPQLAGAMKDVSVAAKNAPEMMGGMM